MYSSYNEGKSLAAERFIKILKKKIYKYMTSKNEYIDKLDNIVNKYNNTYYNTIKMKPVDVKSSTYIDFIFYILKKIIRKILNWKLVIMLEYQNIKTFLAKVMFLIGLKKLNHNQ